MSIHQNIKKYTLDMYAWCKQKIVFVEMLPIQGKKEPNISA
jgi:hypothetical protein